MYRNMPNRRYMTTPQKTKNWDLNERRKVLRSDVKDSEEYKRFYIFYKRMKAVTECTTNKDYHLYGGKGIKAESYPTFEFFFDEQWSKYLAACDKYEHVTISRKNMDGDFNIFNIIWVEEQRQKHNHEEKWFEIINPKGEKSISNNVLKTAKEIGCKTADIRKCLNKTRLQHNGFVFKFIEK